MPIHWDTFPPIRNKTYKINIFDDGMERYTGHVNRWWVCAENWRGKVSLVNAVDVNVRIGSISGWKTELMEDENTTCVTVRVTDTVDTGDTC